MGVPVEFCEPWTTADKLCCPDAEPIDCTTGEPVEATYKWTDDELIAAATGILFRQTCHLFPGHCEVTIRPCPSCACGRSRCTCGSRYIYIDLQDRFPVVEIGEVLINGEALDEDAYRVDDYHRLVRTDGACWPRYNYLSRADTESGTFSVTYTAGRQPPIELQMAAAELACELKRACGGLECRLPRNVTHVSRQGISMDISAIEDAVSGSVSGLASVDIAVRRYDCARAKGRVWHPSLRRGRGVFPS